MYTREILSPRASPIENGVPLQGTWTRAFEEVDLLDVQRPYRCPLPKWILDGRIKEWETFFVQDDRIYMEAALVNMKMFRTAQAFLYDKDTKEKFFYKKVIPGTGWKLPRSLANTSIESRSYGFFLRIHNWLDADTIKLDLDIEADRRRSPLTAHVEYDLDRRRTMPMAVSLSFAERRGMYAFKALAAVRGDLVYGGRHVSLDPAKASGLFCDFKGYYPYRMHSVWCTGFGFDGENRRYGFSIAENQARETHRNNENALWINGELTPLPPVKITMPGGVESDWIIQDVEGMVDMVFSPGEQIRNSMNFLLVHSEYDSPWGHYNGMLMDAKGERVPIRGLWGVGERLHLRV
ncbi:MAG: DUF2804 domain-containing protein [Treponema sp.]|nr:DUF2804 domain-containing protein [Treponema sp.]